MPEPRKLIPVIGDKPPEGKCAACHGTGYYWDQGGHGAFDWKRPCHYCRQER